MTTKDDVVDEARKVCEVILGIPKGAPMNSAVSLIENSCKNLFILYKFILRVPSIMLCTDIQRKMLQPATETHTIIRVMCYQQDGAARSHTKKR